nr:alkane 1-monooxygenase [Cochlodiniinecator piscidefendens]
MLLCFAATMGGLWIWLSLSYLIVFTFILDRSFKISVPATSDNETLEDADRLSFFLGICHFLMLALAVWVLTNTSFDLSQKVALFVSFGMFFGQISNSNAHELIHRGDRHLFELGKWIYISLLFGHHTSAHRLIHHKYVATPDDPNSAAYGQSFYRFFPDAWIGSFTAALEAETQRITQTKTKRIHPYIAYCLGGLLFACMAFFLGGAKGVAIFLGLAFYAQLQLMLSDYVQHYGLRRALLPNGQYESVNERHSWDSPHWFSSLTMLNAPRHSGHHTTPSKAFPALPVPNAAMSPLLPASLPVMGAIALSPRLWRKVMDHRVKHWHPDLK